MYLPDPGWLRPLLAFVLFVLGVTLRFMLPDRLGGFGLRRFRASPDEDIEVRVRHRLGEALLAWGAWLVIQMMVGLPESWVASVWAPAVIVAALIPAHAARLYARRYLAYREGRPDPTLRDSRAWGSWLVVVVREAIPLGTILVAILVIRQHAGELPERVPVWWDLKHRGYVWQPQLQALEILRHRTFLVYGLLLGLEGAYLLVRGLLGRSGDIGQQLLRRSHWLFYFFRVGWVMLFAGLNLGFVHYSVEGGSPLLFAAPGLLALAALGIVVVLRPAPPPPGG